MADNGLSTSRLLDLELAASASYDFYLLEHSEFYDPTIELACPGGLSFTVEVLRGGQVIGGAVSSASGFCKVEVSGTHPPTAQPAYGPSLGFRITNAGVVTGAFRGAVSWTYGRTR